MSKTAKIVILVAVFAFGACSLACVLTAFAVYRYQPAVVAARFLHSQIDILPAIAVIETGRDFPLTTLKRFPDRTHALFDLAAARYPVRALAALDRASRAWLKRWENAHLDEIDEVARTLNRPGAYFFSVNYEWGCTCRVSPSADRTSARLIRVLDWMTPGLGRHLIAARVSGAPAGPFVTLTWPGYTGVLQAMAPQRFSVSLNQAPMRRATGFYYLDWAAGRRRVWSMPHPTPAHLLRHVVEHAHSFKEARGMLIERPISTPSIFSIAGLKTQDTAVIERTEMDARVRDGVHVAAHQHGLAKRRVHGGPLHAAHVVGLGEDRERLAAGVEHRCAELLADQIGGRLDAGLLQREHRGRRVVVDLSLIHI